MRRLLVFITPLVFLLSSAHASLCQPIEAKVQSVDEKAVLLKKPDGKVVRVKLEKLSTDLRQFFLKNVGEFVKECLPPEAMPGPSPAKKK